MKKLTTLNAIQGGANNTKIQVGENAYYMGETFFRDDSFSVSGISLTIASENRTWGEIFAYGTASAVIGAIGGLAVAAVCNN